MLRRHRCPAAAQLTVKKRHEDKKAETYRLRRALYFRPVKGFAVEGARRNRVTKRLRFSRSAPSALRAQLPLSRQLQLIVQRPEWQLPRQSGFAGPEAVADAHR